MEWEFWKALLRLAIFLPLVIGLAYWSIRFGATKGGYLTAASKNMRLMERLSLGPKTGLCIVQVAGRYYLLGVTEREVTFLQELTDYTESEPISEGEKMALFRLWKGWKRGKGSEITGNERYD
ncbi:MAG TPA: flagellar biosynthetic protein FliO [Clostridia bacterium]|nr:flagellar biosynthetic protein FliO [Clostridia bacterium]